MARRQKRPSESNPQPTDAVLTAVESGATVGVSDAPAPRRRRTSARVYAILDMVPDAIVVHDRDGRIEFINCQTESLFGYAREELLGQPLESLIPERFRAASRDHYVAYAGQPRTGSVSPAVQVLGLTRDGDEFPAEMRLSSLKAGTQTVFATSIRDVSERQRLESALATTQSASEDLRRLQALSDATLSHLAVDDLLHELLERVHVVIGVEDVAILLLDSDGQHLTLRAARGLEEAVAMQATVPLGLGFSGKVAATRAPLIVNDVSAYQVFNQGMRETQKSAVGVPLLVEDRLLGVLYVGSAVPRWFSDRDVQLLQRVADRMALALERTRLFEETQTAQARAQAQAAQLDRIFEGITDGLVVYDADGNIVRANPAARSLLGFDAAPLGYTQMSAPDRASHYAVRDSQDRPLANEELSIFRVLNGQVQTGTDLRDVRVRTLDGREVEVTSSAAPLRDQENRLVGAVTILRDQTERHRLEREREEALRRSEAWFHTMADTAPALLWVADTEALVTFVNAPWLRFTGRTLEQELGHGWAGAVHPDDYHACLETYRAAFHARQSITLEYRLRRFDGEYRWVVDKGVPRFALDGSFLGYIGSAIDISERKQMERQLQASEARYRDLVETQTDLICRYLPDGTLTYVNGAYCKHFGRTRAQLIGTKFFDLLPEEQAERSRASVARLMQQPGVISDEHAVALPDGTVGWQNWVEHAIHDAQGRVNEIQAIGRDVTARKRAEEALRASEARFRTAFESAAGGMMLVDLTGRPLEVNAPLATMLGYSAEEICARTFVDLTYPDDVEPNLRLFRQAVAGEIDSYQLEKRFRHKQGHLVWGLVSAGIVRDAAGQPLYLVGQVQDITERKWLEFERLEQVRLLETTFGAIADAVLVYDREGKIQLLNPAAQELLMVAAHPDVAALAPYERDARLVLCDMQGRQLAGEKRPVMRLLRGESLGSAGSAGSMELVLSLPDGSCVEVSARGAPLRDAQGTIVGAVQVVRDETERHQLQRERAEARLHEQAALEVNERMERFLATASHDLRTPITAALGGIQLLERRIRRFAAGSSSAQPSYAWVLDTLENADQELHRLNRLIGRLFDLTQAQTGLLELMLAPLDLTELLRASVAAQRVGNPDRTVRLYVPAGQTVSVVADFDRIMEVVDNYLTNAHKYSPADQPIEVLLEMEQGGRARVSVRDFGRGVPLEQRERIWDLFHRVPGISAESQREKSLGLGLFLCKTLVEQHRGQVGLQSTVGEGSTFWFTLPLADPSTPVSS